MRNIGCDWCDQPFPAEDDDGAYHPFSVCWPCRDRYFSVSPADGADWQASHPPPFSPSTADDTSGR